ncbi:MAG: Gfo/Idh/MocA family oxidoreductase [Verrucomicrobiae bacterium]|nr:Gfo/Idh/MocA family oxidoreductase [Verrucomicrobiae bacterium]
MSSSPNSRRHFLKSSAAALAAPAILPASAVFGSEDRPAPSERVTVALIGCGARGFANLEETLKLSDAQVVAVCDVDTFHYREYTTRKGRPLGTEPARATVEQHHAKEAESGAYRGCAAVKDYREICARDDIDAVIVATPDHWHAAITLAALESGKDVYCEKPVTHFFAEGQAVYRAVAERKAVFQTGSQQRSDGEFRQAVEIVRNGLLGKVSRVEVGLPAGYPEPMGATDAERPPEHLDYDFWTGPAPMLPYMRARNHRWWRGNRAYGGGNIMDWIGHHNDIAHWGLGRDGGGPESVEAAGWTWPKGDGIYDTPVEFEMLCDYPGGIVVSIASKNEGGTKWIGENGAWVHVNRGKLTASDPAWAAKGFVAGEWKAYASPGHHRNFLDGIKTRKPCVAPAETAHRSITPGHLGFVANATGRKLKWDAARETIVGDDAAQEMLMAMPYREGWGA